MNKLIAKILFFGFATFSMVSCIHIVGEGSSFRGLYSYYEREKKQNPDLFVKDNNGRCDIKNDHRVHLINGNTLKECLKNKEQAVVYIWTINCHSKVCIPLDNLQKLCDEKKVDLYVVAEYYDAAKMKLDYNIERPIFGIDTEHYHSNLTSKYLKSFLKDLTQKENTTGRYLYFNKDSLVQDYDSFEFIEKL